jgi:hypothetical protein
MAVDARKRCISDEMSLHCVVSHVYDRMEQLGVVIFSEINQVEVTASRGLARILALHYCSSTLYQIHYQIRCLFF